MCICCHCLGSYLHKSIGIIQINGNNTRKITSPLENSTTAKLHWRAHSFSVCLHRTDLNWLSILNRKRKAFNLNWAYFLLQRNLFQKLKIERKVQNFKRDIDNNLVFKQKKSFYLGTINWIINCLSFDFQLSYWFSWKWFRSLFPGTSV